MATSAPATAALPPEIDLLSVTVQELGEHLNNGRITSVQLVSAFLERIEANNHKGLELRGIAETCPLSIVLPIAQALDDERKEGRVRGALHGIPIVVKDSIATDHSLGMETTAGSLALGAELHIHKEFLYSNSNLVLSGSSWVVGGSPSEPKLNGSSVGCATAVAAGFSPVAVGAETCGSLVTPAGNAALFGLKATVGLASRNGVILVSHSQDSVGPMARSAWDAAAMLSILAGHDPADPASKLSPQQALSSSSDVHSPQAERCIGRTSDYTTAIIPGPHGFRGLRIGVPRSHFFDFSRTNLDPEIYAAIDNALKRMQELGAVVVDPADLPSMDEIWKSEAMETRITQEFKGDLEEYLGELESSPVRTLPDIIQFNEQHAAEELPKEHPDQGALLEAQQSSGINSREYLESQSELKDIADTRGLSAVFDQFNLDALIVPPEPCTRGVEPSAIAGWPVCNVPLGYYSKATSPEREGLPFGVHFVARPFNERVLVRIMGAWEEAFEKRRVPVQMKELERGGEE